MGEGLICCFLGAVDSFSGLEPSTARFPRATPPLQCQWPWLLSAGAAEKAGWRGTQ